MYTVDSAMRECHFCFLIIEYKDDVGSFLFQGHIQHLVHESPLFFMSHMWTLLLSYRIRTGGTASDTTCLWTNALWRLVGVTMVKAISGPSTPLTSKTSPMGTTIAAELAAGSAGWQDSSRMPCLHPITPSTGPGGCRAGAAPQPTLSPWPTLCPASQPGCTGAGLASMSDDTHPSTLRFNSTT